MYVLFVFLIFDIIYLDPITNLMFEFWQSIYLYFYKSNTKKLLNLTNFIHVPNQSGTPVRASW